MASRRSILSFRYNRFSSSSLLALMARLDRPIRDHLWQGLPVTRNAEIDPGDNDPPPKMTQGVMTPLPPLHHLQQHPRAGSQGVGIATLIFRYFRYFLRYFSSTHRTDLSRFRGTFHSFDPVGFAIFAIGRLHRALHLGALCRAAPPTRRVALYLAAKRPLDRARKRSRPVRVTIAPPKTSAGIRPACFPQAKNQDWSGPIPRMLRGR